MDVLQSIQTWFLNADGNLLLWIQEHLRAPWLTPIMIQITKLGNRGIIWIVLGLLLLIPKKTRRAGLTSLLALLCAHLLCNCFLKDYVARVRPYEVVEGLTCLISKPTDWSFPSGHTMTSFAAAIAIYKSRPRKQGMWAVVLASLIAFSRLYVGVHYPSDVIAGILLGTLIAYIFFWMLGDKSYRKRRRRKTRRARR